MKKKILLPTDFSDNAWNAIKYAVELYKEEECEFYVLHAHSMDSSTSEVMLGKAYEEAEENAQKEFSKILEKLSVARNSRHNFFMIFEFRPLLEAVRDVINKNNIDIIVMGTKGATGNKKLIYGSNAILIMEKVQNCPVLTIPEEARYKKISEIIFPTDYKTNFKGKEVQRLVKIARINDAAIRIVHVSVNDTLDEEQESNKKLLEEYFNGLTHTSHIIKSKDVQASISEFIESRNGDMITFVNRKHSFLTNMFAKPLVQKLGLYSKIPILVLHRSIE